MLRIIPPNKSSELCILLPLSKSVANRLLIIRHLSASQGIVALPQCDDSQILSRLLIQLEQKHGISFDAGDAGTVFRFMAALLAISPGKFILTGSDRMKQRPCGPLVKALQQLGGKIEYFENIGFPPLSIEGSDLSGGKVVIDASVSSQFVSALMMIGPKLENGLDLELSGNVVSGPYIYLTADLMQDQGAQLEVELPRIRISPGNYSFDKPAAEGDWSAAAFWYAFAAMNREVELSLKVLQYDSSQGDRVVIDIFQKLGVVTTWNLDEIALVASGQIPEYFEYDFTGCPDLVPAVAIVCAGLGIESHLTGLVTLNIKESRRVDALCDGLQKLGFNCKVIDNHSLKIESGRNATASGVIQTYGDHRIAMAFAMLSQVTGSIMLDDETVVSKSYPEFWEHLRQAGFELV